MQGTIDNNITIIGGFCLELSYFCLFGGIGGYSISGGLALVPWSDWALGSSFPMFRGCVGGDF